MINLSACRKPMTWLVAVCLVMAGPARPFEVDLQVDPAQKDIRQQLINASLTLAAKSDGVINPQDILAAAQADYGRLVTTLYESGHYGPVVSIRIDGREAAEIPPLERLGAVSRITLKVVPGPMFRLGRAEIGPLAPGTRAPAGFRTGAPAESGVVRQAALSGVDRWREASHAKAAVTRQQIDADHRAAQLHVRLGLTPGPKVIFGDLVQRGKSKVRPERVQRIAGIPKGRYFRPSTMEQAAARLRRAGAFSSVSLSEAEKLGSDNAMDIEVALVDAKPRRLGFGAEIQSVEGLTLSGYWMHRNLFGGAERLRIEGEISGLGGETGGIDYTLGAKFNRPGTLTADTDFYIDTKAEQLDEPLYFSRQITAEAGYYRYFSKSLEGRIGVGFTYADVRDGLGTRQFTYASLPIEVTRDRRDDRLNPTEGTYLRVEAMPFVGLNGTASGARGYLDGRAYVTAGPGSGAVFAARVQLGTVVGSTIGQTPPDLLFLSGGSGTVRGHSYQSLSIPVGGTQMGGRSFVGLSGEARIPVTGKIGAVAFYDAGYIGANSWVDGTGGWHSGAGIGLRYQTGIGPIRLDLAVPVSGAHSNSFEAYLGIGQAF